VRRHRLGFGNLKMATMPTGALRGKATIARSEWLPLLIGAILAIWALNIARQKIIEVNEAALGETTAVMAEFEGLQVSCFDASDTERCESDYHRGGQMPAILWFGNSQNFAINRYQPGDQLAILRLHGWLKTRGKWLVQYVQPNANLREEALLFEALNYRYDTRLLILPVFMDKLREQGSETVWPNSWRIPTQRNASAPRRHGARSRLC
jgi:hypothetical protein